MPAVRGTMRANAESLLRNGIQFGRDSASLSRQGKIAPDDAVVRLNELRFRHGVVVLQYAVRA